MSEPDPSRKIYCDICNKWSRYCDPREPWDDLSPEPSWRCEDCIKAVRDAREQLVYLSTLKSNLK